MASISPAPQTVLEAPAQAQPSIVPKSPPFADVATANDSAGSAAAQSSSDNNLLPLEALPKGVQPPESSTEDSLDSSFSKQHNSDKENGTSEGKDETHANFGEKAMEVSKQVVKCGQHLQEMAEQVAAWEEKIRKLVATENKDWKIVEQKDFKALPITPTINLVNWTDFKNKYVTQTQEHIIDVLIGEVKTFSQQPKGGKQDVEEGGNGNFSQENLLEKTSPSPSAATSDGEIPSQIRINSTILIRILSEIWPGNWPSEPILMSRPYQLFAYNEPEIQKKLDQLEAKWADVERGQQVQTSRSLDHSDSSSTTAKREQPITPASARHSETHAKSRDTAEENEISIESPKEATPIDEVESLKVPYEDKLKQKPKTKPSPTELMDSVEALREVRCLMEFINTYFKPHWKFLDSAKCHKIQFEDLRLIFKPGGLVFAPLGAEDNIEAPDSPENQQKKDSKSLLPSNNINRERYQTVWKVYRVTNGPPYLGPHEIEWKKGHVYSKPWPLSLICYYLDFDGQRVSPVMHRFKINVFQGEKDINSLPIYPMKFARNAAKIEDQMRKRGEIFREFDTYQHRYYIGASLVHQPSGDPIRNDDNGPMRPENIASQVIVDFRGVLQANPHWSPESQIGRNEDKATVNISPKMVWKDKERKTLDREVREYAWLSDNLEDRMVQDLKDREPFLRDDYDERPATLADLRDDDLTLLPARVFAYSFRNRKFVLLKVDSLQPVTPRVEGFNSLILPSGHKRTVQALVRSHFGDKLFDQSIPEEDDESDLVRGKGKGLVLLLHGAPGVGKTSTAECVAEANGRPLFPITCGDLGLSAEEVENKLSQIFYLAARWDCVLLLDEADVFLAERTKSDLKRNSLVSVFLRILEYYTGILFLTTNRVGAMDPAFKSRVHMHLYYPPLKEKQTLAIWTVNLNRIKRRRKKVIVDEDEIKEFARSHFLECFSQNAAWNGRQIRNAFQTATALAEYDAWESNKNRSANRDQTGFPKLERKHFETVAQTSLDFDNYMKDTILGSESYRAQMGLERSDEFTPRRHHPNQGQFEASQSRLVRHEQFQGHSGPRESLYQQSWQSDTATATRQPYQSQPQHSMQPVTLATKEEQYSQRQQMAPDSGYSSFPTASFPPTRPTASQPSNITMLTHGEPLPVHPRDNWHRPLQQFDGRDEEDDFE